MGNRAKQLFGHVPHTGNGAKQSFGCVTHMGNRAKQLFGCVPHMGNGAKRLLLTSGQKKTAGLSSHGSLSHPH